MTPEKVNEYSSLFDKSGAENGLLSGIIAKQIFERARLPNEVLGRIWNLADTQARGALDVTEFAIAMHLLASYKSGAMRGVPQTLPPGLYEAAARRKPVRTSGGYQAPGVSTVPLIPAQFTGMSGGPSNSPLARQQVGTPLSAQSTGDGWAISPADKARFDQIFAGLDKSNQGFITGDQAVDFFGNARLPEETLAQIWDLADINSEGRLNRDEFAVAMYLIRQQRGTKEGRGNLPATLPPALVPPMMRKQQAPPSQPTAPAFVNAPVTKPRSAADDLFGLDALSAPTQAPQSTGGSTTGGPFQSPKSPPPPPMTASPGPSTTFKPFVPSSSFGQSLAPQHTGLSSASQGRSPQPSATDDLLGDADPEVSQKLTSETSELANLSNQVGNLSKQMQEVQGTRVSTEQELSQGSQQKKEFEMRLSQLRSVYEKEVKDVKALQEQLSTQRNELKRSQQDMAMLEGGLQDLQSQRQQLSIALDAELREKASLNEKIKATNAEINELKPQVEKMKSEARQQKGLVAISKKQLATLDAERDRLQNELDTAKKDLEAAEKEAEEQSRSAPQTSSVTSPADIASPAASVMSATNPFFRRGTTASEQAFPLSPSRELKAERDDAFDSMFGPSFSVPQTATPPPTSFRTDSFTQQASGTEVMPSPSPAPSSSNEPFPREEPPPPPKSRQITSAALPFREPLERAVSISSSVKVVPAASRMSTPRAATPVSSTISQNGQSPAVSAQEGLGGDNDRLTPHLEQQTPLIQKPEVPAPAEQSIERISSQEIPGAFPESETPRSEFPQTTAIAGGAEEGADIPETEKSKEPEKKSDNLDADFDQYFGGLAHSRSPSEKAAEFDAVFAEFKQPTTNGTGGTSSNEFPPIRELEGEDSDDSEDAPTGFDDDFTVASPAKVQKEKQPNQENSNVASAVPASLQARPQLNTVPSTNSSLPEIEAQKSPPTYGESVPHDNPDQFPPEFKGLLPHRGDPTSSRERPHSVEQGTGAPPIRSLSQPYAPEAAKSPPVVEPDTATPPQKNNTKDDFDSAFADMAPAPVVDDDDEDEFETSFTNNHSTEFDPTFDSPAPSKSTNATAPATISSSYMSTTTEPIPNNNMRATSDFYNFSSNVNDSQSSAPTGQTTGTTSTFKDRDWDDMFASFNQPSTSSPPTTTNPADQTFPAPSGPPPAGASTTTTAQETTNPSKQDNKAERPVPGRALSTGTEHDDPILKRLTAMGWSREDSLKALERFDYNIDKVSTTIPQFRRS